MEFSPQEIAEVYHQISPHIVNTPIIHSATFSELCHCHTLFKLENLQMTGSFKERGALNRLNQLSSAERARGVIAASAGNHAQAVAYHAKRLGISAKIVMPKHSPLVKVRSTEHWGAEVILAGETFSEAFDLSQTLISEENRIYLHPFDDIHVIKGQATLGLEILNQAMAEDLSAIVIPVGGGGLIAGIANYVKQVNPSIKIIGVEENSYNAMEQSQDAGEVVTLGSKPMIADGIAVGRVAERNLRSVEECVDDIVSVSSDEIANAILLMMEVEKVVVEGAAAVTLAALLNHRIPQIQNGGKNGSKQKKVLSIISGGNIDMNLLSRIINRGLAFDGRVVKLDATINDQPGGLERLLGVFRSLGANVLEVHHHRFGSEAPIGQIEVSVTVETRDREHIEKLKSMLIAEGFQTILPGLSLGPAA
ncbi:MAG: threonine dehydratase [Candidatus Azotimanducaceae bacterium]|jgi:threonine dehydratase